MSSRRSMHELLSTPSTSRKKLNTTYVKSKVRETFPEGTATAKDEVFVERSNKLKDIGLTGTIWETYKVNALYEFSYQTVKLKSYERILKLVIENNISKIKSGSQNESQKFTVTIQCFHDMVFTKKDCAPVKITVMSKDEEGSETLCFTGFLLSVERKEGFMENERMEEKSTVLPLFLVDYTDKVFFESVKGLLEGIFSSNVGPLKFSCTDLVWMLALFCPKNDEYTGTTVIEYEVPSEELNSINYGIDPYTIPKVWKRVVKPEAQEISEDQAYDFLSILESHFFDMFAINVAAFEDINVIKTPLARIEANHSILLYDTSKLYFVIRHLTHVAQEIIK